MAERQARAARPGAAPAPGPRPRPAPRSNPAAFAARVAAVRQFNRFYTRRIGVLRKGYLGSPFSLTQVRVLYEIAHRPFPTAAGLGRDLDLDPGYLSRVLGEFEARGLVRRTRSTSDGRQQLLALTAEGREAFAPLDARSERETGTMLRRLSPAGQARLVAAMQTIEALLEETQSRRSRGA